MSGGAAVRKTIEIEASPEGTLVVRDVSRDLVGQAYGRLMAAGSPSQIMPAMRGLLHSLKAEAIKPAEGGQGAELVVEEEEGEGEVRSE